MTQLTYLRYEVIRTYRNRRFLLFSLAFPLILFLAVAGPHKNQSILGISFPLYYMTGMVAWGTMVAVISSGARISSERQVGWTRQLRITPLPTWSYFAAKIFCGYLMAILSMLVIFIAGSFVGVHLTLSQWFVMVGLSIRRPHSLLRTRHHVRSPAHDGLARTGDWWHDVALRPARWRVRTARERRRPLDGGEVPALLLARPRRQDGARAAVDGHSQAWIVIAVWTVVSTRRSPYGSTSATPQDLRDS
jgi:hypothetical protein